MTTCRLEDLAAYLDDHLHVGRIADYAPALNGVQLAHRGPVVRVAAAVDTSLRTIDGAIAAGANLLLVHHGLFWSGLQRLQGVAYRRLARLMEHDVAVYASHLPLDAHETHGNSRLLAAALGLVPSGGFADHDGTACGVWGDAQEPTRDIHERLRAFARQHGGDALATPLDAQRVTRRWAICSGAGADRKTMQEAAALGADTLIVGEGPHWSAVDATDAGLAMLYGGHYATETLGVQSLAAHIQQRFGVPWVFIPAPTGL